MASTNAGLYLIFEVGQLPEKEKTSCLLSDLFLRIHNLADNYSTISEESWH